MSQLHGGGGQAAPLLIAPFGSNDHNVASVSTILVVPPPKPAHSLPASHLSSSSAIKCCAWELAHKGLINLPMTSRALMESWNHAEVTIDAGIHLFAPLSLQEGIALLFQFNTF